MAINILGEIDTVPGAARRESAFIKQLQAEGLRERAKGFFDRGKALREQIDFLQDEMAFIGYADRPDSTMTRRFYTHNDRIQTDLKPQAKIAFKHATEFKMQARGKMVSAFIDSIVARVQTFAAHIA